MVKISRRNSKEVWQTDIPKDKLSKWGYPDERFFSFSRCVWRTEEKYESLWIPRHSSHNPYNQLEALDV